MSLDPLEPDGAVVGGDCFDHWLPEVSIGHRLALAVLPTSSLPARPPPIVEALDHIGRITDDQHISLRVASKCLEGSENLHSLIGRRRLRPRCALAIGNRPGPSTGARIPKAGTIGVDRGRHRGCHASGSSMREVTSTGRFPAATSAKVTLSRTRRSAARTATQTSWRCSAAPS